MATPIGHALAGLAIYGLAGTSRFKNPVLLLAASIFAGIAPDLDVFPGLVVGQPALFHRGVSHSLGMGVLVSLGLAGLFKLRGEGFFVVLFLCLFSYSSHLLLDWLGPDQRPPMGIPIFWPINEDYFMSPITVLLGMRHAASSTSSTAQWLQGIFSIYNLGAVVVEIIILMPLLLLVLGRWMIRRPRTDLTKEMQGRKP